MLAILMYMVDQKTIKEEEEEERLVIYINGNFKQFENWN